MQCLGIALLQEHVLLCVGTVTIKNFMSHSHLCFDLEKEINKKKTEKKVELYIQGVLDLNSCIYSRKILFKSDLFKSKYMKNFR